MLSCQDVVQLVQGSLVGPSPHQNRRLHMHTGETQEAISCIFIFLCIALFSPLGCTRM